MVWTLMAFTETWITLQFTLDRFMAKKNKKSKLGFHPKAIKQLTAIIKDPSKMETGMEQLAKLGVELEAPEDFISKANNITEDPDAGNSIETFLTLPLSIQTATLEIVAEECAAGFLARLQRDVEEKVLSKAVAGAIHKVRSLGMTVPDLKERQQVSFEAVAEPPPETHTTAIDSDGNRVIILAAQSPKGLSIFYCLCGDKDGLKHLEGASMPRGGYKKFVRMVESQVGTPMVPISDAYAKQVIHEAAERTKANGEVLPPSYQDSKGLLAPTGPTAECPIWETLDRGKIASEPQLVTNSDSLFDEPEFLGWIPDKKGIKLLQKAFEELQSSKSELTDEQKFQRSEQLAEQLASQWFDQANRELFAKRLEENAYVLSRTERPQQARIATATALALQDAQNKVTDIPFAVQLFARIATAQPDVEALTNMQPEPPAPPSE